jgi:hypothetical protein
MSFVRLFILLALTCITLTRVYGQAVVVTTRLDTNRIAVGGSTTLHVYAQVVPALRATADQIFSWYLDVLNTNGAVANANYDAMVKPSSDNDPQISSRGVTVGANRNDIYDTFLNLSNAGVAVPVELMSIPVTGTSEGHTRFQIRAGDAVPLNDFLVSMDDGTDIATGGDYSVAFADLDVVPGGCSILLHIAPVGVSGGPGQRLALTFIPCPGLNHTVQYRAALDDVAGWQSLSGAPHNSGNVIVTNTGPYQFFRVSTSTGPLLGNLHIDITPITSTPGPGQRLALTYATTPGYNFTVEYQDILTPGGVWQTVSGAPHNSGNLTVTNSPPQRFYRLRAAPQ